MATHIEHKPCLLHCAEKDLDDFNPWMLVFLKPQYIFTDWDKMIDYLKIIDSGKLDTSHWW
jgi:hypothetical protein